MKFIVAILVGLLWTMSASAQTAGWVFPTASTYNAASGDNGKILASDNLAGGAASITVNLPCPGTVGAGWILGFSEGGSHGFIINAPNCSGQTYILTGQKNMTSFSLPSNTNYEYAALQSDGTNFRLVMSTNATALFNGIQAGQTGWTFLFTAAYQTGVWDNGAIISNQFSGGNTTITLPSTGLIPNGWHTEFWTDGTNTITLQKNGVSGGTLIGPGGRAVTSVTTLVSVPSYLVVSFDGSSFHTIQLMPTGANNMGVDAWQFGFVGDGTTLNDTAVLKANAWGLANGGGAVVFPELGVYNISGTIQWASIPAFGYTSASQRFGQTVPSPNNGCPTFKWVGAAGGKMISISTNWLGSTSYKSYGNFLLGMCFDGNNGLADTGIELLSANGGRYSGLYLNGFDGGAAIDVTVAHLTNINQMAPGENACSQLNEFDHILMVQTGRTAAGLVLNEWPTTTVGSGATGCDSSFNNFETIYSIVTNSAGIVLQGDDNDTLRNVFVQVQGSGLAMLVAAVTNGAFIGSANNITIEHLSTSGTIFIDGTASIPGCVNAGWGGNVSNICPAGINFINADAGNGTFFQHVAIQPGGMLGSWSDTSGTHYFCQYPWVDPECFGARGDDSHDDTGQLTEFFSDYAAYGQNRTGPIHFSSKVYKIASQLSLDTGLTGTFLSQQPIILSDGALIDGTANTGNVTFAWLCTGHTNCSQPTLRGNLTIKGANSIGPVAAIGNSNLTDSFVGGNINGLTVVNTSSSATASGLQLNNFSSGYLSLNGTFEAGGGGSTGYAVNLHGSSLGGNKIDLYGLGWNSASTSDLLRLDGTGVSGNVIALFGTEVGGTCTHASNAGVTSNTFLPFNCTNTAVDYNFTAGSGNVIGSPIYGSAHGSSTGLSKFATTTVP